MWCDVCRCFNNALIFADVSTSWFLHVEVLHVNFEWSLALRMTSVINCDLSLQYESIFLKICSMALKWNKRSEWELIGHSPVFLTILSQGPMWLQMSMNCWVMAVIMSYFCTLWCELGNFRWDGNITFSFLSSMDSCIIEHFPYWLLQSLKIWWWW